MDAIIVPLLALAMVAYLIYNCINYVRMKFKHERTKTLNQRPPNSNQ